MRRGSCQSRLIIIGSWVTALVFGDAPVAEASPESISDSSTTVVIDAGHGGFDRGGIPGQRIAEKTMTLDVAQRLKSVLSANGYHVVMTRDSDVFVPLPTRIAIANSYRNAIFVCIHFNSANRAGADGIETYFFSRDSLPLASAVHYFVAGGAPSPNRGVRRRGYYVLRKAKVPAVLVECGFLTNPTEAAYTENSSYRQKLAEEIAAGIRRRSSVTSASSATAAATGESIPLQSYVDQTKVRSSDRSRSRRSHKSSRTRSSKKKKSSKPTDTEASATSKEREG
jgi:N-acetylmuramoyl-L-alanine amidase